MSSTAPQIPATAGDAPRDALAQAAHYVAASSVHASLNSAGAAPVAPAISSRGVWADPRSDIQLRALWAEGLTAQEIGRRMKLSKNAIIGRAHRMKLPSRPSPILRDAGITARQVATRRARMEARAAERARLASHVSLEIAGRPVPNGLCACHTCDTPLCVNPDHLFIGTLRDNTRDMMRKGRHSPPPIFLGEGNHSARLTEALVSEIRDAVAAGQSQSSLAKEHGVSTSAIFSVVHRRTWRHV